MKNIILFLTFIIIFSVIFPVYSQKITQEEVDKQIENLKNHLTPDNTGRETVFEVKAFLKNDVIEISGKVLTIEQKQIIESTLSKLGKINSTISYFPYPEIGKMSYGIVRRPYINLYVKPKLETGENLATQALMGMTCKILEKKDNFRKIKLDHDGYICWALTSDLKEVDFNAWDKWINLKKVMIIKNIEKPELYFTTKLPLVAQKQGYFKVIAPDNNVILLSNKEARIFDGKIDKNNIINTAKQFLNTSWLKRKTSYLWGGTKGSELDCSGFVQTVFRANGIDLPRDADQQQKFCTPIALNLSNIDELKPGDLIFFSKHRKWATHVGIYIGNYEFIHSSPKGVYSGVKINTLRGGDDYDKFLQEIYFGAGRIDKDIIK